MLIEEIPLYVSVEMEVNQGKLMNEVIENRREFSVVSVSSGQSLGVWFFTHALHYHASCSWSETFFPCRWFDDVKL